MKNKLWCLMGNLTRSWIGFLDSGFSYIVTCDLCFDLVCLSLDFQRKIIKTGIRFFFLIYWILCLTMYRTNKYEIVHMKNWIEGAVKEKRFWWTRQKQQNLRNTSRYYHILKKQLIETKTRKNEMECFNDLELERVLEDWLEINFRQHWETRLDLPRTTKFQQ